MQRQNCKASVSGVLIKEEATVNRKATGTLAGHPVAHRLEQLCLLSISMIPAKEIIIKDLRDNEGLLAAIKPKYSRFSSFCECLE